MFSTPIAAARLFLSVVITLIGLKIAVGAITGSISIWAQAADSSLDLLAAIITFIAVGFSTKPADKEHPFGHGKIENIAASVQTVLMIGTAGSIIYAAIQRIMSGAIIELTEAGIGVMLLSMIASILLSRYLFRIARSTGSVALEANARMLTGDIYSNAGVMIGLVVVRFTGLYIIDSVLALIVALLILIMAYRMSRMAFGPLVDVSLPQQEQEELFSCIREHRDQLVGFHAVRTRTAGSQRFIDLHLLMPRNASVEEAHQMCDHLEQDIKRRLPNSSITIHVEPCETECEECAVSSCNLKINVMQPGH
ncbi:MAG: cation diffusion facilitator family transporter [Dehalococcoidales bacterium]|nr:cation diffusion facilitator family transporter [Dehalococcoidales bacterium]